MARKVRGGRRKGIQIGVQKYKIRIKSVLPIIEGNLTVKPQTLMGISTVQISQLASLCFNLTCKTCCFLYLIPMTPTDVKRPLDEQNRLLISKKGRRACHYVMLTILLLDIFHKIITSFEQVRTNDLDTNTVFCAVILAGMFLILTLGSGVILKVRETVDLINSWPNVLRHLEEATNEHHSSFSELSLSLKIMLITGVPFFVAFAYSTAIAAMPSIYLPFAYHIRLKDYLPEEIISSFWRRMVCVPLDFIFMWLPIMCTIFSGQVLETSISVLRTQLEAMRGLPMENSSSRQVVEKLYFRCEIYNRILDPWYRFVTPTAFLASGATITLCLFVSIRHTELPIFIFLFFPYLGFSVGISVFTMCWDGIMVLRSSEDLVSTLQSTAPAYILRMAVSDRQYAMKRARAARPSFFNIGNFSDFSYEVTVAVMEEILNQLLFLLSF